jgi:hypothetical protein
MYIDIYTYIYISIYIYIDISNGKQKWKPRRFSLIYLPFAHRANGGFSYFRLFTTNGLNGLNRLALLCAEPFNVVLVIFPQPNPKNRQGLEFSPIGAKLPPKIA